MALWLQLPSLAGSVAFSLSMGLCWPPDLQLVAEVELQHGEGVRGSC